MTQTQPTTWPPGWIDALQKGNFANVPQGFGMVPSPARAARILDALAAVGALLPPPAVMKATETEGDVEMIEAIAICERFFPTGLPSGNPNNEPDTSPFAIVCRAIRSLPPAVPVSAVVSGKCGGSAGFAQPAVPTDDEEAGWARLREHMKKRGITREAAVTALSGSDVPTDAEIEEIEKRHNDEPKEQMQSYLSALACYKDRATLLRRPKASAPAIRCFSELGEDIEAVVSGTQNEITITARFKEGRKAAVTMPTLEEMTRFFADFFENEEPDSLDKELAEKILALWNGRA